jgi:hypothetical protein
MSDTCLSSGVLQAFRRAHALMFAVALMALVSGTGCASWQAQKPFPPPPPQVPREVRLTLWSGERFKLGQLRVVGDSIVGMQPGFFSVRRRAIAVGEIRRAEVSRFDGGETLALGVGIVVTLGLMVALVYAPSMGGLGSGGLSGF